MDNLRKAAQATPTAMEELLASPVDFAARYNVILPKDLELIVHRKAGNDVRIDIHAHRPDGIHIFGFPAQGGGCSYCDDVVCCEYEWYE
jgi:hypothetical protein